MRIVEATWEERNLGVTCVEIEVEKKDTIEEVLDILRSRKEKYQVVKVAAGKTDIMFMLQKEGYNYIETLFETEIDYTKTDGIPKICKPFLTKIGFHEANDFDYQCVLDAVGTGSIFSTDRVALDPFFGKEVAGRRYAYWIQDVMSSGKGKLFISEYQGMNIGFNVYIDKGKYYDGMLGGLFPDYLNSGYGLLCGCGGALALHSLKVKKEISHVSSNNFQMLKQHLMGGANIRHITNNFIRHI